MTVSTALDERFRTAAAAAALLDVAYDVLTDTPVGPLLVGVAETQSTQRLATTGTHTWGTMIVGVTPELAVLRDWKMEHGRFITEDDVKKMASVCLIGHNTCRHLFPDAPDPVGRTLRVDSLPLRVVGVLAEKSDPAGAIVTYRKALETQRKLNRGPEIAQVLFRLGSLLSRSGKEEDALDALDEAGELQAAAKDDVAQGNTLYTIGRILARNREHEGLPGVVVILDDEDPHATGRPYCG